MQVTGNISPRGGFAKFKLQKLDKSYLPTWMKSLGYRNYFTGVCHSCHSPGVVSIHDLYGPQAAGKFACNPLMRVLFTAGKFLNGFDPQGRDKCPAGWDVFEPLIKVSTTNPTPHSLTQPSIRSLKPLSRSALQQ